MLVSPNLGPSMVWFRYDMDRLMLPLYTLPLVYIQYCYRRRMVAIPSATSWSLSPLCLSEVPPHV